MKKRIISFLMALIISAMLGANIILPALAVTPADPLIASALYSFLVSAGIKLWRDGIEGSDTAVDDMIDDMKIVWGFYKDEEGANVPSWSNIAGITTSNGKIILEHDTAQTLQAFANWMAENYDMKPGNTYNVSSSGSSDPNAPILFTLPSDETLGLTDLNAGVWALPVSTGMTIKAYLTSQPTDGANYREETLSANSAYAFILNDRGRYIRAYFCSTSPFVRTMTRHYPNAENNDATYDTTVNTIQSINNVSRPNNGNNFQFYISIPENYDTRSWTLSGPENMTTYYDNEVVSREMAYVILAGDRVGTAADLFATVGNTVADKVRDLLDGQSLAIDVGASVGASEEEVIGAASLGYSVPATSAVVPSAVAYPLPVAGASELYPQAEAAGDVDNLGLPALGQALTSRFPFCIPWDVVYLYQSFNATPKRPVFTIDVIPQSLKQKIGISESTAFTLDFGDERFSIAVKLVRWGTLVGFVLFLAFTTKRLIWTTGG